MRGRLTSNHFVGRQGELAELELAAVEAAEGRPSLVLLGGESGVGKTRLLDEFERHTGALVLRGDCVEQGDGELPYAPILSALRPLVRLRHPALEQLSPGSRAQLAALLPGLGDGPSQPPLLGGEEGAGQVRLFEALLELLDALGDGQPLALLLEDMHWADRSTRTFAAFLARSLRQERLMLLLTYRSDELHRRHSLRPLLAELDRLGRARRIALEPFDRSELAEVLGDILGEAPSEQLVDRLFARSEGNPLYTEELLAAGLDGRGAAPQSLRDAFMLRIERLPDDARLAARAVAAGRRLSEETIAQASGIDRERLHAALREAVAEQVLVTGADDRFLFRHELLREALYDDLLPGERGELHLSLARALECQGDGDGSEIERATAIATHYAAAGDQSAALRATVAAALASERLSAYGEVAEMAERALELWPRVAGAGELVGLDHVELMVLAARAHGIGGDRSRGEVLLQRAIAELDPEREPIRYGALLARLARTQWHLNRGREGLDTAKRALAMLRGERAHDERLALLAWLARTRVLRGQYRDAIIDGEEALAATIAAGDTCAEGEVLNTLGMARIALGDVEDGIASLRRARELAHAHDDIEGVATAYANLADLLSLAGRTADALATAREGLVQTPRRLTRTFDWMTLTVSTLAFEAGEWDVARAHAGAPPSQLAGTVLIFRLLRDAELALGGGEHELAETCLEAAAPLVRVTSEAQWHGSFGALAGELRRRNRDLDGAREVVARALDELEVCTDDVMRIARVSAVGLGVEADRAQRARDFKEAGEARDALTRARIHMARLRAAAADGGPVERAWSEVGEAELARARGRNDARRWLRAAAAWEALGRPYPAATARWRAAEALAEADDRPRATEAASAALAAAVSLRARWLELEVRALADRARIPLQTAAGADAESAEAVGDARTDGGDPFGLTARERQVLALLAEGATNRQIGATLYMAEKTASVHVSRILAKLGVRSRTQAAAVAHRLHL
jgi:DNA-binding CsgD family transcriptional regulator/tetratricopeptide (TPR) repeat protein